MASKKSKLFKVVLFLLLPAAAVYYWFFYRMSDKEGNKFAYGEPRGPAGNFQLLVNGKESTGTGHDLKRGSDGYMHVIGQEGTNEYIYKGGKWQVVSR